MVIMDSWDLKPQVGSGDGNTADLAASYSDLTLSGEDEDHRHSAYLGVCPYYY